MTWAPASIMLPPVPAIESTDARATREASNQRWIDRVCELATAEQEAQAEADALTGEGVLFL